MFQSLIGILANWKSSNVGNGGNWEEFQSLIGILANWKLIVLFVLFFVYLLFQSLIGILANWKGGKQ